MSDPESKTAQPGDQNIIPASDRELFAALSREQLLEYIFMQVKNIWRVDGLYFLGIEKRHGMDEAGQVDAEVWRYMGNTEARELKALLSIPHPDPAQVLFLLRHTSWAVSQEVKSFAQHADGSATFSVDKCRTQLIRREKGLGNHPCRQVREGYLQGFVEECNSKAALEVITCPPERTDQDVWCLWRFRWK